MVLMTTSTSTIGLLATLSKVRAVDRGRALRACLRAGSAANRLLHEEA